MQTVKPMVDKMVKFPSIVSNVSIALPFVAYET